MKKMVSVILSVCLLLTLLPTTVFAADQTAEAGAKIVEKSYDESTQILTVDMQIKLPNAVGITSVATMISYDSSKLTLLHASNDETSYIATETREQRKAAVKCLLTDQDGEAYTKQESALYGKDGRAALLVLLGSVNGPNDSQKTTGWLSIYSLRFKVSGPAATTLDSTSLRIADPNLENELVKHTYDNAQTNNYYTVAVVDGGTGLEYYFGKMQDNPDEELNGMKHLMAAEGNNTATYPGSDNAPSLPPASVTAAPTAKTDLKYNGSEQALLGFNGTASGGTMQYSLNGTDWSDTAPMGKDARDYTVYYMVKGDSDHSDSAVAHISAKIEPKEISGVTIGTIENQSYTGGAITPDLVVTDGTATLTKGTDYTVSGSSNTYVGTATLTITGKGNYTGTKDANFTIVAADQKPTFTTPKSLVTGGATLDLTTLVSGAKGDMTFTIASGTAATLNNRYTLTSTGTTGVVKINVSIAAKDVDGDGNNEYNTFSKSEAITVNVVDKTPASVTTAPEAVADLEYNGNEQALVTEGTASGGAMRYSLDGSNWTDTVPKGKDAKTYTVYYKVKGDSDHADYTPASNTVSVSIAQKEVTVAAGTYKVSKKYDGTTGIGTPSGALSVSGILTGDAVVVTTVPVAYTDSNVGVQSTMAVAITLVGADQGNYKIKGGATTISVPCEITAKDVKLTGGINATDRSYVKDNKTVALTKDTLAFDGLVSGETLDVNIPATGTISDAKVGTYNVTYSGVTLKDGTGKASNYKLVGLPAVTVDITKATAPAPADIPVSQKYTVTTAQSKDIGRAGMPEDAGNLTYTVGSASSTGGSASVTASVTGSTVKFTITGGANGEIITLPVTIKSTNYADATVNVVITLTDKDDQAALTLTGGTTVVYGQTLQLGTSGGSGTGAVTYAVTNGTGEATIDATGKLTPTKAGTVTVTATKAADANYNPVTSAPVTITITKATPAGTPGYTAITAEGKTLANAGLTVGTITPAGNIKWVDLPTTTVEANKSYSWVFTPTDTDNYETLTGSIQLWHKSTGGRYYYSSSNSSGTATITAVLTAKDAKSATDYTSGIYGLTFRSTADFSGFKGVKVDGKTIGKDNYVAESNNGSIEVYLKAAYLKTLAVGRHTLTIMATGGNASIDFTIGGVNTAPKTFDAGIAVYVTMAVASVTGMAWMGKKRED